MLLDLFQQGVYTGMMCMLGCLQASDPCMCGVTNKTNTF